MLSLSIESCAVPLHLHDKVYANFRLSFDELWHSVIFAIADGTSLEIGRITDDSHHNDRLRPTQQELRKLTEIALNQKRAKTVRIKKMQIEPAVEPKDRFHMTNKETETSLRQFLISRGFNLNDQLTQNGSTGPDVVAKSPKGIIYYIEVIGYKKSGPARSRDFYEAIFRTLARLSLGAQRIALACPFTFQDGLNQRVKYLDQAWLRIGAAFPELELWFVYPGGTELSYGPWNYWGHQTLTPKKIIDYTKKSPCRFGAPIEGAAIEFHEQYQKDQS